MPTSNAETEGSVAADRPSVTVSHGYGLCSTSGSLITMQAMVTRNNISPHKPKWRAARSLFTTTANRIGGLAADPVGPNHRQCGAGVVAGAKRCVATPDGAWRRTGSDGTGCYYRICVDMGFPCTADADCSMRPNTTPPARPFAGDMPTDCYASCLGCTFPAIGTILPFTISLAAAFNPPFGTCCAGAGWTPNPPDLA